MQTILGFWCFHQRSSLLGGWVTFFYVDNGFGELVPAPLPVHSINSLDLS